MTARTPAPLSGPQPALGPVDKRPEFDSVMRGYDAQQVDGWIHRVLAYIERLEREGLSKAEVIVHAAAGSPAGQKAIADLIQLAADEVSRNQAAAAAEASQVVADAEALAAQIKAAAQQEAVQVVAGAQEQANTVVQQAHAQGKQLLDDAAQKAAAVNQGAEQRMLKVKQLHSDTLSRITEINRVTGELLGSEQQRGSLDDEVQRLLSAR